MCYAHLTQQQRYQIEELIEAQHSVCCIARKIRVHRCTIYRELKRGRARELPYRAEEAQKRACRRAQRSAANHPTKPAMLWTRVRRYVRLDYSPEQARGRLWRCHQQAVSVSAIYAHIRRDRCNGGGLHEHLRYAHRRRLWGSRPRVPSSRPSIRSRPLGVATREQVGHWEGDTFTGTANRHHTLVLVERTSRFLVLRHPRLSLSTDIAQAAIHALRHNIVRSITFDNGGHFANYEAIAQQLHCAIYFADPGRPSQRGTCENTIGLIRQYIPKGSSGHQLSANELQRIVSKLNHRPRKCLGFRTPHEVLCELTPVALRR